MQQTSFAYSGFDAPNNVLYSVEEWHNVVPPNLQGGLRLSDQARTCTLGCGQDTT